MFINGKETPIILDDYFPTTNTVIEFKKYKEEYEEKKYGKNQLRKGEAAEEEKKYGKNKKRKKEEAEVKETEVKEIGIDVAAFCRPHNGNEIWPMLLEKAWAKVHGSYARI